MSLHLDFPDIRKCSEGHSASIDYTGTNWYLFSTCSAAYSICSHGHFPFLLVYAPKNNSCWWQFEIV